MAGEPPAIPTRVKIGCPRGAIVMAKAHAGMGIVNHKGRALECTDFSNSRLPIT